MITNNLLLMPLFWLLALLMTGCSNEVAPDNGPQAQPDGTGRICVTIATPEATSGLTRAVVNPFWEAPDHEWEKIQTFRILICDSENKVVQILTGDESQMSNVDGTSHPYKQSATLTSGPLAVGSYKIYATANYADGYDVGSTVNSEATVRLPDFNGYTETNIPMSGKLDSEVSVTAGADTDAGIITVWRMVGKLSFEFVNETNEEVKILGIEVEPINQASTTGPGIYLFSKDDLESEANLVPLFPANATKTVSATWALDDVPTQGGAATVSLGGVFTSTALSWGSKVTVPTENTVTTYDKAYTLQKFVVNNNTSSRDEDAVISFKVTPATGMSFTPKNISFKVCRGGTDGGKFDVVAGGTSLATGVTPPRYNGTGGSSGTHEPPFYQEYSYAISASATTGEYVVNIYLYNLDNKDYAFRDIVISGDVTNNTGAALQEHITLPAGATTDIGPVAYNPVTALTLAAKNDGNTDEGNLFFYVNETDASFTTTNNQLSIRLKIQRGSHTEELRYGMTTPYIDGTTGGNGFNVIRRNDWIHIPIHLTDWQFRVEPLAYVPIAGYPATTVSSDGLTTTFSTGGPVILQPFAQKANDGIWRDFIDAEVTFQSLTWTNGDGTNVSGTGKIFETAPTYDAATGTIVGVLNNSLAAGTYKTSVTVNVKLGPSGSQYDYAFTFNLVLQK